jgi:hypothetical protein
VLLDACIGPAVPAGRSVAVAEDRSAGGVPRPDGTGSTRGHIGATCDPTPTDNTGK